MPPEPRGTHSAPPGPEAGNRGWATQDSWSAGEGPRALGCVGGTGLPGSRTPSSQGRTAGAGDAPLEGGAAEGGGEFRSSAACLPTGVKGRRPRQGPWLNDFIFCSRSGCFGAGQREAGELGRRAAGRGSLPLPQVDVDHAADQGEGEGHPSEGEAITEAAPSRVLRQDLLNVDGVDQGPCKHCHACGENRNQESSGVPKTTFPSSPQSQSNAARLVGSTAACREL